jgi:hypothetical protein
MITLVRREMIILIDCVIVWMGLCIYDAVRKHSWRLGSMNGWMGTCEWDALRSLKGRAFIFFYLFQAYVKFMLLYIFSSMAIIHICVV